MEANHLINLASTLSRYTARAEATTSSKAAGNATLFERLRNSRGCTLKTAKNVMVWFDTNWPADLEWPSDAPRPQQKEEAA